MQKSFAVGWRQVGVCFLLLAATGMVAATYSIIAVPLATEYHPSRKVLMLSMTVLSGTCALLSPFLGHLMDRISLRRLMVLGGISLAAGYFSFSQVLVIFGTLIAPATVATSRSCGGYCHRWYLRGWRCVPDDHSRLFEYA